jgi:hypothetical protein
MSTRTIQLFHIPAMLASLGLMSAGRAMAQTVYTPISNLNQSGAVLRPALN